MKSQSDLELIYEKMNPDYQDQIRLEIKRAQKEKNAEKVVYYEQALGYSAVVSFDRFKGSWAYGEWLKNPDIIKHIKEVEAEFKRFSYLH